MNTHPKGIYNRAGNSKKLFRDGGDILFEERYDVEQLIAYSLPIATATCMCIGEKNEKHCHEHIGDNG